MLQAVPFVLAKALSGMVETGNSPGLAFIIEDYAWLYRNQPVAHRLGKQG